ncbi:DUF2004 domain-containing protein [Thorsellia anophelis]|uniref:Uncharacterized protein n=1 Tax=Thorsellia anophelis DSM 18579 TaxID=1123402 RepID=A0A1I0E6H4_9GAMM|nr:DUF2004 domain-containing protein [Thorsellia anophelis]SET40788.1 Protein of unknown function [Thorsellia anophelis DSM 18579]
MKLLSETFSQNSNNAFHTLDLNYNGKLISVELFFLPDFYQNQIFLDKAAQLLPNLEQHLPEIINFLHLDLQNNPKSTVREYCIFHLEELTSEVLARIFPNTPLDAMTPAFLIDNFLIDGMFLCVNQNDEPRLMIAFAVNTDYSDELFTVYLTLDGKLSSMRW